MKATEHSEETTLISNFTLDVTQTPTAKYFNLSNKDFHDYAHSKERYLPLTLFMTCGEEERPRQGWQSQY